MNILKPDSQRQNTLIREYWEKELQFYLNEVQNSLARIKELLLLIGYTNEVDEIEEVMSHLELIDSTRQKVF